MTKRTVPDLSASSMLPEARSKQKKRYRDSTVESVVMMRFSRGFENGWHLTLKMVHPMETIVATAIFKKVLPFEMSGTMAIRNNFRTYFQQSLTCAQMRNRTSTEATMSYSPNHQNGGWRDMKNPPISVIALASPSAPFGFHLSTGI